MITLKSCNNLGPRRYEIKVCKLCGSIYARRKSKENDYIPEPWMREASEDITQCTTCGQTLEVIHLETEKEYIELLKPQLEIYGRTRSGKWLMHEMYKTINNMTLEELEETE